MATSEKNVFDFIKEDLQEIKAGIITKEKLIQILKEILREELDKLENNQKIGIEKIQKQIIQMKINNNKGKKELDFSNFQMPPDLPWGKTSEPKKNKDKDKIME